MTLLRPGAGLGCKTSCPRHNKALSALPHRDTTQFRRYVFWQSGAQPSTPITRSYACQGCLRNSDISRQVGLAEDTAGMRPWRHSSKHTPAFASGNQAPRTWIYCQSCSTCTAEVLFVPPPLPCGMVAPQSTVPVKGDWPIWLPPEQPDGATSFSATKLAR